jgi:aminoglycoside phosphotransferase (APT) family kinase protein
MGQASGRGSAEQQASGLGAPEGIDRAGVEGWFAEHVPGADFPLAFERISGGHSNLTYGVADSAGGRWALRRPPLGKRLASAHDMAREHRIISALQETAVPVPPVVGICEDESVNGAPFYVMDFVAGPVLRTRRDAEQAFDEAERGVIGRRLVDTLVAIHAVDPDAVGLGDLGR